MAKLRVNSFGVSLDGFAAGPDQGLENPLGVRGPELMQWAFPARFMRKMLGMGEGGETGTDNRVLEEGFDNLGAWILGRNMFGPVRGPWPDDQWKGWWGDEPPYHCPVFVLTHHARAPLEMKGGTTFYFVTDGIRSAYDQAMKAASGKDVRVGGGAATVRQYLQARLLDSLHLAMRPVLMGRGENLFSNLDLDALGYEVEKQVPGERATHMYLRKRA